MWITPPPVPRGADRWLGATTFTAPHGCTDSLGDIDFDMPRLNLQSDYRVYRSYSNCWAKHYEQANFMGPSVDWGPGGQLPWTPRSIQWS